MASTWERRRKMKQNYPSSRKKHELVARLRVRKARGVGKRRKRT